MIDFLMTESKVSQIVPYIHTDDTYHVHCQINHGAGGVRDIEWQWHQLGHMQICTLTET